MNYEPTIDNPARERNAELHSAVSQIWNLLRVRIIGSLRHALRPADFKSAIQQIENLRYAELGSRQALLHLQSSAKAHRCAFTGLLTT